MGKPLYNEDRIIIRNLERNPEDHELLVDEGEGAYLLLQRGILREFAESTPAHRILGSIDNFDSTFRPQLKKTGLTEYEVHLAMCRAHMEEERKRDEWRIKELQTPDRDYDNRDMC